MSFHIEPIYVLPKRVMRDLCIELSYLSTVVTKTFIGFRYLHKTNIPLSHTLPFIRHDSASFGHITADIMDSLIGMNLVCLQHYAGMTAMCVLRAMNAVRVREIEVDYVNLENIIESLISCNEIKPLEQYEPIDEMGLSRICLSVGISKVLLDNVSA